MSISRKPEDGGGSGTPGASHPRAAARGRPGVGTHSAGSRPGVGAHGPGSGRLTFGRAFRGSLLGSCHHVRLTFVGPRRGRDERRCRGALARQGVPQPAQPSRVPRLAQGARGRRARGRQPGVGTHPAAGRPRAGPGSGLTRAPRCPGTTFTMSPRGYPTPPRPRASVIDTLIRISRPRKAKARRTTVPQPSLAKPSVVLMIGECMHE